MDPMQRETVRKNRIAKLKSEMEELIKTGVAPEAAASLLVAAYVGELSIDLAGVAGRLTEVQTQLAALVTATKPKT